MFGRNRRTSKRPLRVQLPQPIERGRGQQMHERTVEKCTLWQTEVGDGIPVIEALDIRPVLLSCGRPHTGQCGQFHLTLKHLRELSGRGRAAHYDDGAIRERDADRSRLHTGSWHVRQRGPAVEQLRPLPRVLRACNLPVGAVDQRVASISQQPDLGDIGSVQLFSHHGLDGLPPERNDRTKNCRRHR